MPDRVLLLAASLCLLVALLVLIGLLIVQGRAVQRLRLLAEQSRAGSDSVGETTRRHITDTERALLAGFADLRAHQAVEQGRLQAALSDERDKTRQLLDQQLTDLRDGQARKLAQMHTDQIDRAGALLGQSGTQAETTRTLLETKLRELREANDAKLAQIQTSVNEQLHQAVEQQMTASFARVIDQFNAVQKAMSDVQAVTAQIGDIKRLFSNVKTRGGWGETQVRAMLDDILPAGSYETNWKLRDDSDQMVDFAVLMPMRGTSKLYLPIDAKFPVEDYERLLAASDSGDAEAEKEARRGLDKAIRVQARSISEKYLNPPITVEFAVMYLPTDGLYAEAARIPGMIDDMGRIHRVLVLGPSLFPALIRTIQLGQVTLALEQKSDEIRRLLGATKKEMLDMDRVLERVLKQVNTVSNSIEDARKRTRVVGRKLRDIEFVENEVAALIEDEAVE